MYLGGGREGRGVSPEGRGGRTKERASDGMGGKGGACNELERVSDGEPAGKHLHDASHSSRVQNGGM
jgi:hypothetical protein